MLSQELEQPIEKHKPTYVGKGIKRVDATKKVTGKPIYIRDVVPKKYYFAKIVRSEKPHAIIENVDVSEAIKMHGVVAVLTAKDIPGVNFVEAIIPDKPFLAENEVRYIGEEVAIVVAVNKEIAELAAKKVKITYKELDFVDKIGDIEQLDTSRIICTDKIEKGNISEGFSQASVIVEEAFETGLQEHAYIEPQGVFADATQDIVKVKAATQCPYYVQKNVSKILGLPMNKVSVEATYLGGGFGGKEEDPSWIGALAALASYKVNAPVVLFYDRDEDILSTTKRHPSKVKIKIGADRNGVFKAIEAKIVLDGGAYGTISPAVLFLAMHMVSGPYKWPNVKIDGIVVRTNRPPSGAFRGFGAPQALFAIESAIDMLAERLNMDPLEIRLINALEEGDETAAGQKLGRDTGIKDALKMAKSLSNFYEKRSRYRKLNEGKTKKIGIGVSSGWLSMGLGPGGFGEDRGVVFVQFNLDGTLVVHVGVTEMGQGSETAIQQIAADIFGLKIDDVKVIFSNTLSLPDTGPTVASRTTMVIGNAIKKAAEEIIPKILSVASKELNVPEGRLIIKNSKVISLSGESEIKLSDVIAKGYFMHNAFAALGWYVPPKPYIDEKGTGKPFYGYSFAVHVAEVEVDTETGVTRVTNVIAVHDSGKIINPLTASGQVEGGIVQGIGMALYENAKIEKGRIVNNNFTDYLIPTIKDAPNIHVEFVEKQFDEGPFGAKGIGEIPLVTIIPAVTNAVSFAIGKRIKKIPVDPESLYKLIKN
ncbi:MAG: xanthine dehydrogenase family protein molybdopterin-binding subunit [Candidatus Asgardarchaeia archaeon]